MLCTKCGARLMETDQFCPKCGARVIREKRCPDCGERLRDGVKFCPGCGRAVGSAGRTPEVSDETLDIPIEAIERNILSETAAEIKTDRRAASDGRTPAGRVSDGRISEKRTSAGSGNRSASAKRTSDGSESIKSTPGRKKQASVPAPPPRKKKPVYQEEIWEDDDWEEEDDWEDDDWDDDDEEGIDAITIMTVATGCILLIVVAVLGFHLYRQYVPKDYEKAADQEERQEQTEQDSEDGGVADGRKTYTLTIDSNVNVRDEPGTSGTNVLKVARAGETYTCYGTAGDGTWYEIVLEDGSTGYVFQDYVSVE